MLSRARTEGPAALSPRSAGGSGSKSFSMVPLCRPSARSPAPSCPRLPGPRPQPGSPVRGFGTLVFLGGLRGTRCPDTSEFRIALTLLPPGFVPEADSQLLHSCDSNINKQT
ncbi:unnamed protein product [Rangifer tarandus platyrhynchus]|uniref:Uncharacterized protein n=2 Tax=Rangifer tarandus platyrhynchus TaxID=3082113 RepID=A0ACB0ENP1_RANTA|nr:unnamed protein product [Rangifer tarandus platyrhynchus]CAI9702251.1 unnamed protein product [Rangifer tarandus platyrhynchus]